MDIPKNFPKPPTYHRQRFLLALLQSTGGCLSKLDLQKLLFFERARSGACLLRFYPLLLWLLFFSSAIRFEVIGIIGLAE